MKIYVASSWRNEYQPKVVQLLREAGHEVYDFKNPSDDWKGFAWSAIDEDWEYWSPETFREKLSHPLAEQGYNHDFNAMQWADACVMVMPCGRSAHAEIGWMAGAGKITIALITEEEPELMYKLFSAVCVNMDEVIDSLSTYQSMRNLTRA